MKTVRLTPGPGSSLHEFSDQLGTYFAIASDDESHVLNQRFWCSCMPKCVVVIKKGKHLICQGVVDGPMYPVYMHALKLAD